MKKKPKRVRFEPFDFETAATASCMCYIDDLAIDDWVVDKHISLFGAVVNPCSTILDNLRVIEKCANFEEARLAFVNFLDGELIRAGVKLGKQLRGSYSFDEIMAEAGKLMMKEASLNKPLKSVLAELARGALLFQKRLAGSTTPELKEQKSWYDKQNAIRSILFLQRYNFDNSLQERIVNDIISGRNTHYVYHILPYIKFSGNRLARFMKNASRDMVILYLAKGKVINRKVVNILRLRVKTFNLYWQVRGTGMSISMFNDARKAVRIEANMPFDGYREACN